MRCQNYSAVRFEPSASYPLFQVCSAVLHGTDPLHSAEALGEVAGRGKAQHLGDEGEGVVGFPQEEAALFYPTGDEIVDG